MQNLLHNKSLYDIFSDLHGKDSKTLICNMSWKLEKIKNTACLPLNFFPMLGETNNQFYMALVTINLIGQFPNWMTKIEEFNIQIQFNYWSPLTISS